MDGQMDGWTVLLLSRRGTVSKVVSRAADLGFPEAITFMTGVCARTGVYCQMG